MSAPRGEELPAWLEDAAHDRLVETTARHLGAAEEAGTAAEAARAEAARLTGQDGGQG